MNLKLTKIRKLICIFFVGLFFLVISILSVFSAEYRPNDDVYSKGDRTLTNGTYVSSVYGFSLVEWDAVTNVAKYNASSHYKFEGRAQLFSDNLYVNDSFVGLFDSNNGWHNAGTIQRDEVFPAYFHSGRNDIVTRNVDGVGGESEKRVYIDDFATPPEVIGTNGVWNENDVSRGIRTWQSLYTDGAAGSIEGNKVQTSTGFMYKDFDEQETPVNAYQSGITVSDNSVIEEIKNGATGETLPLNIDTLNNAGFYWIKSCTKDKGELEGCGTRYITVVKNDPPVITGTDKTFYQGQYSHEYWINTLRWSEMNATDTEDGNITSKVDIIYDNVNVNVQGSYKVVYSVTDNGGKSASKEIKVTVKYNNPPVITGTDKTFYEGQYTHDYWINTLRWSEMNATDVEDGNLTSKVNIIYDNVNVNVPNVYKITYHVIDSFGKSATKEIKVTVKYNNPPKITGEDRWFFVDEDVTTVKLMERVKASDIEDGNITSKAVIKSSNVQSGVIGEYKVTYKVTDAFGKTAETTVKIHIVSNTPGEDEEIRYLRFINSNYMNTLKEKSIWKNGEYEILLKNSIEKEQDEQAIEVWHISSKDIKEMKEFDNTNNHSKQSAQAFYEQFKHVIK